jgi:hypothetical protein
MGVGDQVLPLAAKAHSILRKKEVTESPALYPAGYVDRELVPKMTPAASKGPLLAHV